MTKKQTKKYVQMIRKTYRLNKTNPATKEGVNSGAPGRKTVAAYLNSLLFKFDVGH